jgi:predicted O-methyltransferase YrrM
MKLDLFPVLQYIKYFLKKEDRHALQSPFTYQIYQGLKEYKNQYNHRFPQVENLRQSLFEDDRLVTINDLGAGSQRFSSKERKIANIARYSCSSKKYSLLYQYFCSLTPAQTVVELGTCLGINSCYLAEVTRDKLYSFEGADELVRLAKKNIEGYEKIQLIAGDISETLPIFLRDRQSVDFAFIDANHTYEHTLSYFKQLMEKVHADSIVIIGDIHWSKGMENAWMKISNMEQVRLSLDFFECGVLLFKAGLNKQHYILNY